MTHGDTTGDRRGVLQALQIYLLGFPRTGLAVVAVDAAMQGSRYRVSLHSRGRECFTNAAGAPLRVAAAIRLRSAGAAVASPEAPQAPCRGGENRSDFRESACKAAECLTAVAAFVLAVAGSVVRCCTGFPRAVLSSVVAQVAEACRHHERIRRTEDVGGAGHIVAPGKKVKIRHSPTNIELEFTRAEMRAPDATQPMKDYADAVAAAHTPLQDWSELIQFVPSTSEKVAATTAMARLLDHPNTEDCGFVWVKRGPDGNKLYASGRTGDVCVTGYGTYGYTDAQKHDSKRQAKNTLVVTPELATAINEARDKLVKESLDGEAITLFNLPMDRPMVGFIFGLSYMLEEMQREANGARFIGGHFVNSADKMSKFAWHVDDHDEDEPGGSYIEHSVLTMCSLGASSIAFAPIGEVHYEGPGSIIKFRGWTPHRSALVKPEPAKAAMWKFASFYAGESSADFEEVTADDETGTDQSVRHDDEESPYYYTVLTGSAAYEDFAPWLRAQLVAGNLGLGQLVTQGGTVLTGLKEMGKSGRACSAMARVLWSQRGDFESTVAGIGAIDDMEAHSALVLCSIWVNASHRGRRLWQRLLSNLLDEIEPLYLRLGSGLSTAFDRDPSLRRCLESIGWTRDTVCGYLRCADARRAMQRVLGGRVAAQAGPVTRGVARTSSAGVAAAAAQEVSRPASSGAKSPRRSCAASASGGDAAAAAQEISALGGTKSRGRSCAAAASDGDADITAAARIISANKRVASQLSQRELKASRVLKLWRLTLDAINAQRLVEAEEVDEAPADVEVSVEEEEIVTVDAIEVDDSDPAWDPTGGSGDSDDDSGDGSAKRVAKSRRGADEPAVQDVLMAERATGSSKPRPHRMANMLPLLPVKRGRPHRESQLQTSRADRRLEPKPKRGPGRYADPGLPEGWQTMPRTTSSGRAYVEHRGPEGQVERTKAGAWRNDALRFAPAAALEVLAVTATADDCDDGDDDARVRAIAEREGLVLQRSVAWQKVGVGGRSAANVGVGSGRSSNSHMKKTDTGYDSVFKNRSNRFEARLKVPGMPPLHVGSYDTPAMAGLELARVLASDDATAVLSEQAAEKRVVLAKALQTKMRLARDQQRDTAGRWDDVLKNASDAEAASIAEAEGLELQPNLTKEGYVGVCWQKSSYRAAVDLPGGCPTTGQRTKIYLGRFKSKTGGAVAVARWIAVNAPDLRPRGGALGPRVSGRVVRGDPGSGVTVGFASLDALRGADAVSRALRGQAPFYQNHGSESASDNESVGFSRFLEQEGDVPRD